MESARNEERAIFDICDRFRDRDIINFGIRLEDRKLGEGSILKFESKE